MKGIHYEETFSPVVSWSTVRLMLTLSEVYGWHARQIDFVLAFPQANVKTDIYMQVPEKFTVNKGKLKLDENAPHPSKQDNVVKLIKNVYGLADASLTWHNHLKKGLSEFGFKQSEVDPCLFFKGQVMFILYVDDGICLSPTKKSEVYFTNRQDILISVQPGPGTCDSARNSPMVSDSLAHVND